MVYPTLWRDIAVFSNNKKCSNMYLICSVCVVTGDAAGAECLLSAFQYDNVMY